MGGGDSYAVLGVQLFAYVANGEYLHAGRNFEDVVVSMQVGPLSRDPF